MEPVVASLEARVRRPDQLEVGQHLLHHDRAVHPVGVVRDLVRGGQGKPDEGMPARLQDAPHPGHGYPVSPRVEGVTVATKARVLQGAEGNHGVKFSQSII